MLDHRLESFTEGPVPAWVKRLPFQVDVAGIIRLMGRSLYSRPNAAIRELIQNAHDGIMRRRSKDLQYHGRIDFFQYPQEGVVEVADDGVGLTQEEVEKYLGTLGIGLSGLLRGQGEGTGESVGHLIGEFGIGLFSAFLLADRVEICTRHFATGEVTRWEAGPEADIVITPGRRETPGTTVRLYLKPEHRAFAEDEDLLERAIKEYAEFLPLPIYINGKQQRVNVGTASWLEPTPDMGALELELESYFGETPLDVFAIRQEKPVAIRGALYVTPQRTPGFTDVPALTVTVRRMIISRKLHGLLPDWASFVRGVLELSECSPTTSREDLVRDTTFYLVRDFLDRFILEHFQNLAREAPARWQSLIAWHRYLLAGAALEVVPLRHLLRDTYRFITSRGEMTFPEILKASTCEGFSEDVYEAVIWYNPSRHLEGWLNEVFAEHLAPCVHTLRSFEEALLALMVADVVSDGRVVDFRVAGPSSPGFATSVLGIRELTDAAPEWQRFLGTDRIHVSVGEYGKNIPVLAFLSERSELHRTFEVLQKQGGMPTGFQRLISAHFQQDTPQPHEVILNRRHPIVDRALSQSIRSPLASVLRLLVNKALQTAGLVLDATLREREQDDLAWIAETLWGRS